MLRPFLDQILLRFPNFESDTKDGKAPDNHTLSQSLVTTFHFDVREKVHENENQDSINSFLAAFVGATGEKRLFGVSAFKASKNIATR